MIKKEIAEKLFKITKEQAKEIELSEQQKIELSLVEDLRYKVNLAIQARDEMKRSMVQHSGLLRAARDIRKVYEQVESQAKELGLPMPAELKGFLDMADKLEKQGQAIGKAYDTL